jgi:RNA polymerase sigma-70 factor, ECF subfamily
VPDLDLDRCRRWLVTFADMHVNPRVLTRLGMRFGRSDVVSEACINTLKHEQRINGLPENEQRAYLCTLLANKLREMIRRERAECRDVAREQGLDEELTASGARVAEWLPGQEQNPAERCAERERQARVVEAISQLPDDERQALILQQYHGWTRQAIADHLGCTIGAVGVRLARALDQLRVLLGDLAGDVQ